MTDQLEAFSSLNYTQEADFLEDDADRYNDLTFGAEIPWDFDSTQTENFDESNDKVDYEIDDKFHILQTSDFKDSKVSKDLLGLSGSFFNQSLFKTNENSHISDDYQPTNEFELAIQKLDLLDKESKLTDNDKGKSGSNEHSNNIVEKSASSLSYDTRFSEVAKFSEYLFEKFRLIPKENSNLQILNQTVSSHLTALINAAQQLLITQESLLQLRYFRILKNFTSIDRTLNDINLKHQNSPIQKNAEIATIIQNFSIQPPLQQAELSITHPFYANLVKLITTQNNQFRQHNNYQSNNYRYNNSSHDSNSIPEWATDADKRINADYNYRNALFDKSGGGWISGMERDWLKKIQTRNLSTINPYIQDYYYTKLKLKELTEIRNKEINENGYSQLTDPNMLLPSPISADQLGAGIDPNKEFLLPPYQPIHFENSLGVLSPSNLNTPRQIIQIPSKNELRVRINNNSNDSYRQIRSQRELLGLIEKMYSIILRIDEVDKSLARVLVSQNKNSSMLMQHRNYLLKLLMDCVNDNTKFTSLFSVAKGARIFVSLNAIVSPQQFIQLMRLMFFNCLSIWESAYFNEIELELKTIIISRLKVLKRDDLSMLITAFFCDLKSVKENAQLRPLSGFCKREFGLFITFTVMECFLQNCPEDKLHIDQLLVLVVRSVESQSVLQACLKDFNHLFIISSSPVTTPTSAGPGVIPTDTN